MVVIFKFDISHSLNRKDNYEKRIHKNTDLESQITLAQKEKYTLFSINDNVDFD